MPLVLVLLSSAVLFITGCGSGAERDSRASPAEIALPDLSRADEGVQRQLREAHASLTEILDRPASTDVERGQAFGRLGMLLHAAEYYEAAEPAYRNAQTLIPAEPKWPYFLARLYTSRGDAARAEAAFGRVLELRPDALPALVWLGRLYLGQGAPEKAEPLFERAQEVAPGTVAALAGLGQTALARKDFTRAAALLEEALERDPSADSIHSPLAMAYRGLGDTERAESHLERWRNTDILVPDPWRQELDLSLESGLSYELRGVRALEARDFEAAAAFFRNGAALSPETTGLGRSLRHKLGTALYLAGDLRGATTQFEQVVRAAPPPEAGPDETAAKAHYSLGILNAADGHSAAAIEHLEACVEYSPSYVEARQALGDALRRAGRAGDALPHYARLLAIEPNAVDARFGYGMALVAAERYAEARDWFEDAVRRHPEHSPFMLALARLLAAAPDGGVRDGRRALSLVDVLLKGEPTVELGETTAMALAELGDYAQAAAVQRQVMTAAADAGLKTNDDWMRENLRLFERGRPSRVPWPKDDPIHRPAPPTNVEADLSPAPKAPGGLPLPRR